jgi:hypothetical protein
MMGQEKSVAQLMKLNFPSAILIKCSYYSIHPVASYACKILPNSLEDLVRNFTYTSKKCQKDQKVLRIFKSFNEEKYKKICLPLGRQDGYPYKIVSREFLNIGRHLSITGSS